MKKLTLSLLSISSLVFFGSSASAINLPLNTKFDLLARAELKSESASAPYNISLTSDREKIQMELPNGPGTETYALSLFEDDLTIVTLSYHEDTLYILSIEKKMEKWVDEEEEEEEWDDEEWDDEEEDEEALEEVSAEDIELAGFQAIHIKAKMSGDARKEFLSCYVDDKFADHMTNKYTSFQFHAFIVDTLDHEIQMIVCGPPNQDTLEKAALTYAHSLQVTPHS